MINDQGEGGVGTGRANKELQRKIDFLEASVDTITSVNKSQSAQLARASPSPAHQPPDSDPITSFHPPPDRQSLTPIPMATLECDEPLSCAGEHIIEPPEEEQFSHTICKASLRRKRDINEAGAEKGGLHSEVSHLSGDVIDSQGLAAHSSADTGKILATDDNVTDLARRHHIGSDRQEAGEPGTPGRGQAAVNVPQMTILPKIGWMQLWGSRPATGGSSLAQVSLLTDSSKRLRSFGPHGVF